MLHDIQLDWIKARFRHFSPERCAGLFHEEQPPGGMYFRRRGGQEIEFPAVTFTNAVHWYLCRDRRPLHRDGQSVVKTDAPANLRPLLYDTLDPDELTIVEGEGHLVACVSVGLHGVVTAGGTSALSSTGAAGCDNRARLRGKSVRILFDPDEFGRRAAPLLKKRLLEAGAARVAIVDLRQGGCSPDDDVEDWLNSFDTPEQGFNALREVLLGAVWSSEPGTVDQERNEDDVPLQEQRFPVEGSDVPTLAVMVWDGTAQLAIYGPAASIPEDDEPEDSPHPGDSVEHDAPSLEGPRAWHVAPSWRHDGITYVPDMRGGVQTWLDADSLVLPPPPDTGEGSSAQLWVDVTDFYRRWFAVEPIYYSAMTAYCFMTYRLRDASFDHIGFLRFVGPPSSGKNRALDVMRFTCWRAYTAQPSSANLHRVVDYFGNFTLVVDEFHPSRAKTDSDLKALVDLMNLSFQKSATLVRMEHQPDGSMVPNLFRVFGPKILASYAGDEDEAFARRSVVIPTGCVEVPEEMVTPQLPNIAKEEARALRARLLTWRARKLSAGLPPTQGSHWGRLVRSAGTEVSQVFWPLLEMVPASQDAALEDLLELARLRRLATHEARHVTEEAYALDTFASAWESGLFHRARDGWFISTAELVNEMPDDRAMTSKKLGGMLKRMGLEHTHRRYSQGDQSFQRKGFLVRGSNGKLLEIMRRHGVEWPRTNGAESDFEEPAAAL